MEGVGVMGVMGVRWGNGSWKPGECDGVMGIGSLGSSRLGSVGLGRFVGEALASITSPKKNGHPKRIVKRIRRRIVAEFKGGTERIVKTKLGGGQMCVKHKENNGLGTPSFRLRRFVHNSFVAPKNS